MNKLLSFKDLIDFELEEFNKSLLLSWNRILNPKIIEFYFDMLENWMIMHAEEEVLETKASRVKEKVVSINRKERKSIKASHSFEPDSAA